MTGASASEKIRWIYESVVGEYWSLLAQQLSRFIFPFLLLFSSPILVLFWLLRFLETERKRRFPRRTALLFKVLCCTFKEMAKQQERLERKFARIIDSCIHW